MFGFVSCGAGPEICEALRGYLSAFSFLRRHTETGHQIYKIWGRRLPHFAGPSPNIVRMRAMNACSERDWRSSASITLSAPAG